jgi:hypothetical protein
MSLPAYLLHRIRYAAWYRAGLPMLEAVAWIVPLHVAADLADHYAAKSEAMTPAELDATYVFRTPKKIGAYYFTAHAVGSDNVDKWTDAAWRVDLVISRRAVRALDRADRWTAAAEGRRWWKVTA